MTVITTSPAGGAQRIAGPLPPRPRRFVRYLRETGLLVGRGLRTIPRVPERLSDVTIQPIMFTLLFLYVFGSAIHVPGSYQDYLLPGLLGQSVAFGVIGAGVATSTDFSSGVVDRFRSLPVIRMSVISAQVIGQIIEQILGIVIVAGVGLGLGWRPHLGGVRAVGASGPDAARAVRLHLGRSPRGHADPQLRRHAGHRVRRHAAAVVPGRVRRSPPRRPQRDRPQ